MHVEAGYFSCCEWRPKKFPKFNFKEQLKSKKVQVCFWLTVLSANKHIFFTVPAKSRTGTAPFITFNPHYSLA